MTNILFCCGGGFSSSTMVKYIQEGLIEYGLNDKYSFTFCPFQLASRKYENYDIIVCCPHLNLKVAEFNQRYIHDKKPIYVLPIRQYGPVDAKELVEDIDDLLKLYDKNPHNPVQFPNEKNPLKVKRIKSYRNTYPEADLNL